jgi:hypothetical protein
LTAAKARIETEDLVTVTTEGATEIAELVYLVVVPRARDLSAVVREIGALSSVRKVECTEPFFGA